MASATCGFARNSTFPAAESLTGDQIPHRDSTVGIQVINIMSMEVFGLRIK